MPTLLLHRYCGGAHGCDSKNDFAEPRASPATRDRTQSGAAILLSLSRIVKVFEND